MKLESVQHPECQNLEKKYTTDPDYVYYWYLHRDEIHSDISLNMHGTVITEN